jgi:hypothetical protein
MNRANPVEIKIDECEFHFLSAASLDSKQARKTSDPKAAYRNEPPTCRNRIRYLILARCYFCLALRSVVNGSGRVAAVGGLSELFPQLGPLYHRTLRHSISTA